MALSLNEIRAAETVEDIELFPVMFGYRYKHEEDEEEDPVRRCKYTPDQCSWQLRPPRYYGLFRVGENRNLEVMFQMRDSTDFCGGAHLNSVRVNVIRKGRWSGHIGTYTEINFDDNEWKEYVPDLALRYPKIDWETVSDRDLYKLGHCIIAQSIIGLNYDQMRRGLQGTDRCGGPTAMQFDALARDYWAIAPLFVDEIPHNQDDHENWMKWNRTSYTTEKTGYDLYNSAAYYNPNSGATVQLCNAVLRSTIEDPDCLDMEEGGYYNENDDWIEFSDMQEITYNYKRASVDFGNMFNYLSNWHYLRLAPAYYWRNG